MRVMRQDQAAEIGNIDSVAVALGLFVGDGEHRERRGADGVPESLDRGDLGRLILQRVEAVLVAEKHLQRHEDRQQPQRHRQHAAAFLDKAAAAQIKGADADHDKAGRDVESHDGVGEAPGEGWVEDDLQPVLREKAPIDDFVSYRSLHPAVGRQDPKGREQRSPGHHQGRDQMRPARYQPAPEQHHAEKSGFEKEGGQPLISEERRQHIGGGVGKPAPIGAELERHDDARHNAHAE